MREEIQPCPKCGSKVLARKNPIGLGFFKRKRLLHHGVLCVMCGHSARTIKAWNKQNRELAE